jgi:hypothetical protein
MPNLTSCFDESLRCSMKVLQLVDLKSFTKEERKQLVVKAYSNGREQGFAIVVLTYTPFHVFVVTVLRGGDKMALYSGTMDRFDINYIPAGETRHDAETFQSELMLAKTLTEVLRRSAKLACQHEKEMLAKGRT